MAAQQVDIACLAYVREKAFRGPVGATAFRPGTLLKFASNVLVPLAADDKQIRVYVALENADASGSVNGSTLDTLVVPLADCRVELGYTGGTPTVGTDYGISDAQTLDVAETTAKLLTVVKVNSARTTVECIEYQLAG